MKYIILLFLSLVIFSRDKGDFVKDIKLKEIEFQIPKIDKEEIAEGTKMYSIYSPTFPIVFLDINLYSGEKEASKTFIELPGLMAETIKLSGTKNYPGEKLSEKLEFLGAKFSFGIDYDKLKLEFSFLKKDEKIIYEIVHEILNESLFDETILENAKKKSIEMISRRNERTESIGFRKAKELFYRNTGAGLIAQIDSIKKIKLEDIQNFWKTSLKSRKTILVNGDYSKKLLLDTLKKSLPKSEIFAKEELNEEDLTKSLSTFSKKSILVEKKVNQSMMLMIGVMPAHNSKDFYSIQILDYIIGGGGFNSYLMQKIRVAKGLAYSSTSYPVFKKKHGILYAYTLTKNESLVEVQNLMKEILSEKTFNQIKEEEIETAKTSIINQFVFMFSNDSAILENELRFDEDSMPENYLKNYRKELQKVTLADLKRVGKKYFDYSNLKNIVISDEATLKKLSEESFIKISPEDSIGK